MIIINLYDRKNNKLRSIKRTPCVIYSKYMKKNLILSINNINLKYVKLNKTLNIKYDNKIYNTMVKEIQYNPINNQILHFDLHNLNKLIYVNVKFNFNVMNNLKNKNYDIKNIFTLKNKNNKIKINVKKMEKLSKLD